MSDESEGLIERAAVLFRRSSQPQSNQGDDHPRSYEKDNRANHAQQQVEVVRPGSPPKFNAHIEPEMFDKPHPRKNVHSTGDGSQVRELDYAPFNPREVLAKFWSRRRLIFGLMLVGACLSYVTAKMLTPIYTGEALVVIRPQQAADPATNASVRAAILGGPEAVPSEAIVLQSRDLAGQTIERLQLDRDPVFNSSLTKPKPLPVLFGPVVALWEKVRSASPELAKFLPGMGSDSPNRPSTALVDALIGNLKVYVLPRSNVIAVSFSSPSATTAAAVPNTLLTLYLDQLANEKGKALAEERERLDTLVLPALRKKLQTSELALAAYRQKSALGGDKDPKILALELSDMRAQLAAARARKAEATTRLAAVEALSSSPGRAATGAAGSAAASPEFQALERSYDREVELQAQLSGLTGSLGPNNPKVQELAAQLVAVRGALRRGSAGLSAGLVGRLKAEVAGAQASEAALNLRAADLARQYALVAGDDTRLQSLIRDADTDRQTYERYLARANDIYGSMGRAQPDARLVSRAAVPLYPSFPKTRLMVMLGAVIGAGAGIVFAAIIDHMLGGLRSARQVEDALGVRCLGLLPLKRWRRNRSFAAEMRRAIQDPASARPGEAAFGQAIRGVQLKLIGVERDVGSQVVLVTAALPKEGKSWTAVSLAVSLAAEGFRVALVDCDLHRPTVHRLFNAPRGPGLTDYFAGVAGIDEVVHVDHASAVEYVPIGSEPSREARYITFDRLRRLVAQLQETHRFIILDSPPVLAASETAMLSQIAQKTIFVVRWGRTNPQIARHAIMQLYDSGAAEAAVLLSMVDFRRASKYGDVVASTYTRLQSYY